MVISFTSLKITLEFLVCIISIAKVIGNSLGVSIKPPKIVEVKSLTGIEVRLRSI